MFAHNPDLVSMYGSIASLFIALASFVASLRANSIAKSSLSQAIQVASREKRDCKQRKWFDLYFQPIEAYDFFDEFQSKYKMTNPEAWSLEGKRDWNRLMTPIRRVHATAMVFPPNPVIDKLCLATAVFAE